MSDDLMTRALTPFDHAALRMYQDGVPVAVICAACALSDSALFRLLRRLAVPLRRGSRYSGTQLRSARPPRPPRRDKYAPGPRTPAQIRAAVALAAHPAATLRELSVLAGVSVPYLSRLRRHYAAQQEPTP